MGIRQFNYVLVGAAAYVVGYSATVDEAKADAPAKKPLRPAVSKQFVAQMRGDLVQIGEINQFGDFVERPGDPDPLFRIYNKPRQPKEPVYEYRAGTLTKGVLLDNGDFVPDAGSTVISFKDYKPGKDAPRIYNYFPLEADKKQ